MILLIDNYDSFSYNLVQLIGSIAKEEIKVVRNDEISVEEVEELSPEFIILSPGPGRPEDAGICEDVKIGINLIFHLQNTAEFLKKQQAGKDSAVF